MRERRQRFTNLQPALLSLSGLPLQGNQIKQIPTKYSQAESTKFLVLTVVSILCIVTVLLASTVVYCLRHRSHHKLKEKLTNLGTDTPGDATTTYQVGGATAPSGLFTQTPRVFSGQLLGCVVSNVVDVIKFESKHWPT